MNVSVSGTVSVGETFDVTVYIDPTVAIGGWEISISYGASLLNAISISPGSEWTTYFESGTIDNVFGTISSIQSWKTDSYPDTYHIACTITFQALQTGTCNIDISSATITDPSYNTLTLLTYGTSVIIED